MRRKLLGLIILPLICVSVVSTVVHADTGLLSGTVTDSSGNPLQGATVQVNDPASDSATTDSSGHYSVSVQQGTYDVHVTPAPGSIYSSLVAYSQNLSTNTNLNFILTNAGTAILSGHVYDQYGNPVANQAVNLLTPDNQAGGATTDATGYYSEQVNAGNYKLDINNQYSQNDFTKNIPGYYDLSIANFSLNQDVQFNITLPTKKVTAHVIDANNNPVPGVKVSTNSVNGSWALGPFTATGSDYDNNAGPTTDASGNAVLYLFPGTYSFNLTPSDTNNIFTTVSNVGVSGDSTVNLTIQTPITLSGHIYGGNAAPTSFQTINVRNTTTGDVVGSAQTDTSGQYNLQIAPGSYKIELTNFNHQNDFNLPVPGYYDLSINNTYVLDASQQLDFTLPVKQFTITTQDSSGNPVSSTTISTNSSNGSWAIGSYTATGSDYDNNAGPTTDASGNASIWLFPSTYTLTATPSNSNYVLTNVTNVSLTDNSLPVVITLASPVTLSGHMYDQYGNPVANQAVNVLGPNGIVGGATTDATGIYTTSVAPGSYTLDINNQYHQNDFTKNIPGYYDLTINNFHLSQNTQFDITMPTKKVIVHVQDVNSNPVSGIRISTGSANGSWAIGSYTATGSDYDNNAGPTTDASGNAVLYLFPSSGNSFIASPSNSIYAQITVNNVTISNTDDQAFVISLQYAHQAPTTTATLSPAPYSTNNYPDPVTATLNASAASGYTVASTYYTVDNGSQQIYANPFTVSGVGSHTITFWSVDNTSVQEAHNTQSFNIVSVTVPTNLTAPSPTHQSPSLSWTQVSNPAVPVTSFNVYRNGSLIGSSSGTSFTDSSLTTDGAYSYYVKAVANNGNESASSNTVNVVYDTTPPTITYTVSPAPNTDGWNNSAVTVTFTCGDSLSGMSICPSPVTLNNEGTNQTVTGTATDNAGNNASVTTTPINIDKTAPAITYSVDKAPNANGWNNSSVTVTFTCSDSLSGIASCPSPVTLSNEGANQTVTGTATDKAGNSTTITTGNINIDKTSPTITYIVSPAPNTNGWNNSNVTVTFNCNDSLSGIASCPAPVTVSTETAGQTVSGTATDKAGNASSNSVVVKLDKTAPGISSPTVSNALLLTSGSQTIGATVSDNLSGVAGGEYYLTTSNTAPTAAPGTGTVMIYTSGKLSATFTSSGSGTHYVWMRTKDAAGNWSGFVSTNYIEVL